MTRTDKVLSIVALVESSEPKKTLVMSSNRRLQDMVGTLPPGAGDAQYVKKSGDTVTGTLNMEQTTGDAQVFGSPTLAGRPIKLYGDALGGIMFYIRPSTKELFFVDNTLDVDLWDKALVNYYLGAGAANIYAQSEGYTSFTSYMAGLTSAQDWVCFVGGAEFTRTAQAAALLYKMILGDKQFRFEIGNVDPEEDGLFLEGDGLYFQPGYVSSLPSGAPLAAGAYRGKIIRVEGASGVKDLLYQCKKKADNSYAWLKLLDELDETYSDAEAISAVEGEATLDLTGNVTVAASKSVSTDTINEKTAATGVTVDSALLKDGGASFTSPVGIRKTPSYALDVLGDNSSYYPAWFQSENAIATRVGIAHGSNAGLGLYTYGGLRWSIACAALGYSNNDFTIYNDSIFSAALIIKGGTNDIVISGNVTLPAAKSVDCYTNGGYMKIRRLSQAAQPTPEVGEILFWRDTDDDKTYIISNDVDVGVRKVELT